jgi:predicted transcriptional regulator
MNCGEIIFNRRMELGISQKDLANAVGVSGTAICKIEKGNMYPSDKLLTKIWDVLKISPDHLTEDTRDVAYKLITLTALEKRVSETINELETIRKMVRNMIELEREDDR